MAGSSLIPPTTQIISRLAEVSQEQQLLEQLLRVAKRRDARAVENSRLRDRRETANHAS